MLARLGPAPAPLVCAVLVVAMAAFAALVPIGRPPRPLDRGQAFAMVVGAAMLATWAVALGVRAWQLTGQERGVVLSPPMSPGVADLLFSVPLLVVVPVAAAGLFPLLRGGRPTLAGALCALLLVGLVLLREVDRVAWASGGKACVRAGWLWARSECLGVDEGVEVTVVRDSYRGAPSWAVRLRLPGAPARTLLGTVERRFRSEADAGAEAQRWRDALRRAPEG